MKILKAIFHIITLGIPYAVGTFKLYKRFIILIDINKDGRISKDEIIQLSEDIVKGKREIKIVKPAFKNKKK